MNGYIALKSITLNGTEYAAGDSIPADAVLPSRVPALVRTKTIQKLNGDAENTAVNAETPENGTNEVVGVDLPINTENGVMTLSVSREDITKAVEIMQLTGEQAEKAIAEIESEDILIVLNACDSRKTVKKAAQSKAAALHADDEEDETADKGGDE